MPPGDGGAGPLRIRRARRADDAEWDRTLRECAWATFFHSRAWAQAWSQSSRGRLRPSARVIEFSDGASALLPLSVRRGALGRTQGHVSSPGGTYGGWISADALDKRHAALLLSHLLERCPGLAWRANPFNPAEVEVAAGLGRADHTLVLRLEAGFDALLAGWSKGHRSAARKALREGVVVEPARDLDAWRAYHEIYREALARWGERATSWHDWSLFAALFSLAPAEARLWLARRRGEILAGALVLTCGDHAVYWHGASRPDAERLRPVQGLLHEIARQACAEGFAVLDLNPSGPHAGVEAFKRGFGARALPSPVLRAPRRGLRARLRSLLGREGGTP